MLKKEHPIFKAESITMEDAPNSNDLAIIVKVTLLNKSGEIFDEFNMRAGANLWVFLRKRGLPIGSACSGVGVCGACNVKIIRTSPQAISSQTNFEKETLEKNKKPQQERLACLSRIFHDITIQAEYW